MRKYLQYVRRFGVAAGSKNYYTLYHSTIEKGKLVAMYVPMVKRKIFLRAWSSDRKVFEEIFIDNEFTHNLDVNPKTIVDCGANIGLATLFYKYKFPNARVVAIEPDAENFEVLLKNIEGYKDVTALQKGIWYKDTKLSIVNKHEGEHWGIQLAETGENDNIEVVSMNGIFETYNVPQDSVVKIDIEGGEKELFSANLEWVAKTKVIVIELHDHSKPGCGKTFFDSIKDFNYNIGIAGEKIVYTRVY